MKKPSKPPVQDTLSDLHGELASYLQKGLVHGMEDVTEDGSIVRKPPSPAYLNVVRQFLKDNKIEALPASGSPMGKLVEALPAFEDL
jgi:hypothetical protein